MCAHQFGCKLVYDTTNGHQDESAADDTSKVLLRKENCGSYSWNSTEISSAEQELQITSCTLRKRVFLPIKFPFLMEPCQLHRLSWQNILGKRHHFHKFPVAVALELWAHTMEWLQLLLFPTRSFWWLLALKGAGRRKIISSSSSRAGSWWKFPLQEMEGSSVKGDLPWSGWT